ncbi:DUF892 family protein [Mucilaginibacter sp. HD30]
MQRSNPSIDINLGGDELKEYFLLHLNKVFCAKQHLLLQLPRLAALAAFQDLKDALAETTVEIKRQLARMKDIFGSLNAEQAPDDCKGIKRLIDDVFEDIDLQRGSQRLQDMSIIYYLQNIESLQIASFQALKMAAVKFNNKEVNSLLDENFKEAQAERELLLLLSAKYLIN